ncbi:MAG TPA: sulfotransferase [Solirubrobacterales bacterium]|nr:sulfotransferase [Solirubrobacterales bacterium]
MADDQRSLESNEDRLVWIFGSSRSGSTWLLRMLSDFAGVVPIDDPHLGHHLGVWRPIPLAWAASSEPAPELTHLLELKSEQPGYFFAERYRESWWQPLRALIQARFEAQAEEAGSELCGPPTYVVKEPGSHVAPLLAELFPRSKLIFLLRDGRDVVDSWLAAHQDGSWAIRGGAFPVAPEGRIALIRWLSTVWAYRTRAVLEAYEARAPGDRLLIRYEQMRDRPERSLEELCEITGLDAALAPDVAFRHRFERLPVSSRGPLRKARAATPGSWRENLSPPEQAAMQEALGETLALVGYDRAKSAVA